MLYKLKSVARRGTLFGAAAALAVSAFAPLAPAAYADALNPLTERSLTLSSSAPGWENYDGSGNPTYAQPNSGANGKQTGNTFDFKVSSTSGSSAPLKGMTFQYCTTSAGECRAPGDNASPGVDTATTSDLKVVTSSPAEVDDEDFDTVVGTDGNIKAVPGFTDPAINSTPSTTGQYAAHDVAGNFVVYYESAPNTWTQSSGWTMSASNVEDHSTETHTNQNNFITLANSTGLELTAGTRVKVVFFGTETNYIQNPGSGSFFVKINTYNSDTTFNDTTLVDGGVTVANVMNHSIRIQTKVLETMKFSVGTVDPNTLDSTDGDDTEGSEAPSSLEEAMFTDANLTGKDGSTPHTPCDPILGGIDADDPVNVLKLGDQSAESSLSDQEAYATHSYWRLSSNSSAGATVYYSGVTLSNTVGDKILPIGPTKQQSTPGAEQFGLGLMNSGNGAQYEVDYSQDATNENADDQGLTAVHASTLAQVGAHQSWHTPRLAPLVPEANYNGGSGTIQTGGTAQFAFDETSNSIPVALATQDSQVVDCVTAKVRYIANIAATTPAGIYTTAVNYIAAPQY